MTTPQLPPLPEQSMTHHITDEQILTEAQSRMGASAVERIGTSAVIGTVRAVLALAAPQAVPMTDTERADMICAVAAICTGTSSRNLAATAIEWTELRYGITTLAAPAPAVPSDVLREMREFGKARMAEFMGAHHMALVLSKKINEWADKLTAAPTPPAQSEPTDLTGCNCRWKGGAQVEWCEHHLAHRDAIHDWAQRAKIAEAKLTAATPAVPSLQPACRYISEVLAGDAPSGEKHIARTIMHLLPLEQAMQATPAVPEDVAREPMTQRWCWWLGDAETFHVANTESEAHSEAQSRIDDDCEPGDTREYSVGRVQHPIDALGVEWLAEHVAETIEENTREWCDDNTGAEDPSITLAAEDRKVLGTMVAAFLREKVSVHWWTADQKTITTHTYVAGSSSAIDAARAAEKGGE